MKFKILSVEDYEMVHLNTPVLFIAHKGDVITYIKDGINYKIKMPRQIPGILRGAMCFRKLRRLFRLDKAVIMETDGNLVLFRQHEIWRYSFLNGEWNKADIRLDCRNPMYNGVLRIQNGDLYVGEYGSFSKEGKKIYKSMDNGATWACIYTFQPEEIRHIHCLAWDNYENMIWVFTGDKDSESKVLCFDMDFKVVEVVACGSQKCRSCHVMFSKDSVDWIMDSPNEMVRHVKLDRKSRRIKILDSFAGPVWFAQKLSDDCAVAASVQEIGVSHTDNKLHIYASCNMSHWEEVADFQYDGWPKGYFRYGTMTFARGNSCESIYVSCEGVKKYDGKSLLCRLWE